MRVKKAVATVLLLVGLAGCGLSSDCDDVQATIKTLVERHIELDGQIQAAGGMRSAPQDLRDAYSANQDELKAAYTHSIEVCAPES